MRLGNHDKIAQNSIEKGISQNQKWNQTMNLTIYTAGGTITEVRTIPNIFTTKSVVYDISWDTANEKIWDHWDLGEGGGVVVKKEHRYKSDQVEPSIPQLYLEVSRRIIGFTFIYKIHKHKYTYIHVFPSLVHWKDSETTMNPMRINILSFYTVPFKYSTEPEFLGKVADLTRE